MNDALLCTLNVGDVALNLDCEVDEVVVGSRSGLSVEDLRIQVSVGHPTSRQETTHRLRRRSQEGRLNGQHRNIVPNIL